MTEPTTDTEVLAPIGESPADPNHYHMRYPTLDDLLYRGGREGVEYCLVAGFNQRKFGDVGFSAIQEAPTSDTRLIFSITGPNGTVPSVILMGRGDPIPGSDDYNGVRPYNVDVDVEEATGIPANDESPLHFNNIPEGVVGKPDKAKKESVTVIEGK